MAKAIEYDEGTDNLEKIIAENKKLPIFVIFYATWCPPCKALKPVIQKTCKDNGFVLISVDVDNNPELSEKYGVQGIPFVHLFLDGKSVGNFAGNNQDKLKELVEKAKATKK